MIQCAIFPAFATIHVGTIQLETGRLLSCLEAALTGISNAMTTAYIQTRPHLEPFLPLSDPPIPTAVRIQIERTQTIPLTICILFLRS